MEPSELRHLEGRFENRFSMLEKRMEGNQKQTFDAINELRQDIKDMLKEDVKEAHRDGKLWGIVITISSLFGAIGAAIVKVWPK